MRFIANPERPRSTTRTMFVLAVLACDCVCRNTQAQSVAEVDKALAFLRQIDPAKVTESDEEKVTKQIQAAWDTIHKAGAAGTSRVKQELAKPNQSDYFKLNLGALLWTLGGLDEAETIASVWRSTKLDAQSNYVFYPSFEAAMTQDTRALPMLHVVLGDQKFGIYVLLHALEVKWPLTEEFIWGAFGPKGLPELLQTLKTSHSPAEIQSAITLLTDAQIIEALPLIRQLVRSVDADTRTMAIIAIGEFGDPHDYDFLIAGVHSKDPAEAFSYAVALYEFEDLRAVPELIPLLNSPDAKLRHEAFAGLSHLLTSASVDALIKYAQTARGEEKAEVDDYLQSEFRQYKLTLADYSRRSPEDRVTTIDSVRRRREEGRFELPKNENPLTHDQFIKAAESWKKSHHMRMSLSEMSLDQRQLLAAATVDDIPLLLEVKAAILGRLSDECLYEVKSIHMAIKRLGRSRYRKDVGITEKAEAK